METIVPAKPIRDYHTLQAQSREAVHSIQRKSSIETHYQENTERMSKKNSPIGTI